MPKPILSTRSRISKDKADRLLKGYASRLPPGEAAKRAGISLNTVYEQYARIRWRLIEVGYYQDAALSKAEAGLSQSVKDKLRLRRGIEGDDIYSHAAEVIEWEEEWPPELVLKHLRKIIELTGPIDMPLDLTALQTDMVAAYVRYARTQLIEDRVAKSAATDAAQQDFLERIRKAIGAYRRDYRSAAKRVSRHEGLQTRRRN